MISDWLCDDGRKAIEVMGWPEWDMVATPENASCPKGLRLSEDRNGNPEYLIGVAGPTEPYWHTVSNHEALCLLRDWAREWLVSRNLAVEFGLIDGKPRFLVRDVPRGFFLAFTGEIADARRSATGLWGDYDAALIAAVLATKEATNAE